jgi:hypothetical protein
VLIERIQRQQPARRGNRLAAGLSLQEAAERRYGAGAQALAFDRSPLLEGGIPHVEAV